MKIVFLREYDMTTEPLEIRYNANELGDTSVSDTYLEVTGLPEGSVITAIGHVLDSSVGVPMKFADMSNIGIAEDITKDGIYMILSGALEKLVLNCTGTAHVIVKEVA